MRKEWNDAEKGLRRPTRPYAHAARALLETEFRGGDLTFDAPQLDGVHHKLLAREEERALAQRRASATRARIACPALSRADRAFAPCGHRALCAQCEGELKRRMWLHGARAAARARDGARVDPSFALGTRWRPRRRGA